MRKSMADVMFAFRVLIEKHRKGQKELQCIFFKRMDMIG